MYNNYRYGDPALRTINTLFLAMFITQVFFFLVIFGALSSDMLSYAGLFGLSVSLNGGMCRRPVLAPVQSALSQTGIPGVQHVRVCNLFTRAEIPPADWHWQLNPAHVKPNCSSWRLWGTGGSRHCHPVSARGGGTV